MHEPTRRDDTYIDNSKKLPRATCDSNDPGLRLIQHIIRLAISRRNVSQRQLSPFLPLREHQVKLLSHGFDLHLFDQCRRDPINGSFIVGVFRSNGNASFWPLLEAHDISRLLSFVEGESMFIRLDVHGWKNDQEFPICQNREKPLQVGVAETCGFEVSDCVVPWAFTRYASGIIEIFFEAEWVVARKGNKFNS